MLSNQRNNLTREKLSGSTHISSFLVCVFLILAAFSTPTGATAASAAANSAAMSTTTSTTAANATLSATPISASTAAAVPVKVQITRYEESRVVPAQEITFLANQEPRIVNNRVLVPLRVISERLGYSVNYDSITKIISIKYASSGTEIILMIDSTQALINGRNIALDTPPDVKNGVTFVPLRIVAECFDVEVHWDAEQRTVTLKDFTLSHPDFVFDKYNSNLFLRNPITNRKGEFLAKLDIDADLLTMKVFTTKNNNQLIRFTNWHGEPHIFVDTYDVYIAEGTVIAQGHFGTGNLSSDRVICANDSIVVMADNRQAVVYDDATQEPVAAYDLIAIFGVDSGLADLPSDVLDDSEKLAATIYDVIGYGDNYLLVRSGSMRIALAHLGTQEVVWLFEEFYDDEMQAVVHSNPHAMWGVANGDFLYFIEEKDGKLFFEAKGEINPMTGESIDKKFSYLLPSES